MTAIFQSISINTAIANFIIFEIMSYVQNTLRNDVYSFDVYEIMFIIVFVKFILTGNKYKNINILFTIWFVTFYLMHYLLCENLLDINDFSLILEEIVFVILYFTLTILAHYTIVVLDLICLKLLKVLYTMKYMINYFFLRLNFSRIKKQ